MTLFSRATRERHIDAVFADAAAISDALGEVEVPADVAAWLGRLHALIGVPFGYLVPDERMLPPESIRFFRLDENWVRALLDGAFSLGRDLTTEGDGASANVDRAAFPAVFDQAREAAPRRAREGVADTPGPKAWTGFLLRSSVVADYPGLGVNVYPKGGTPDDKTTVLLDVKRLDRLGPKADTLLCLVDGDAFRVDVHEAPELLHYGIDDYKLKPGAKTPTATKRLYTFTREKDGAVSLGATVDVPVGGAFRARSPRVLKLTGLATTLAAANPHQVGELDSAQMGFAMTEGVGMVSFERRDAP
jgi:hypothetical protein